MIYLLDTDNLSKRIIDFSFQLCCASRCENRLAANSGQITCDLAYANGLALCNTDNFNDAFF